MCRFLISDVADTRALESNFDTLPDWGDVVLVKMSLPAEYRCPISLDTLVLPYITPCGHVFSLVSIVGHMMSRSPQLRGLVPCPLCSAAIIAKDIRPVQRARYSTIEQGEVTRFCLLRRHKESNVLERMPHAGYKDACEHPEPEPSSKEEFYPSLLDTFCKVTLVANPENIWMYIVSKLTHECDLVRREGDSEEANLLVPIFLAATELVLQHCRDWIERRTSLIQEKIEDCQPLSPEKCRVLDSEEVVKKLQDRILMVEAHCQKEHESRLCQQAIDKEFPSLVTQPKLSSEKVESFTDNLENFQVPVQHVRSMYGKCSDEGYWFMYHACDGQFAFLSPFCMKILLCWRDKIGELPSELSARVLDIESMVQKEGTRKRYKPMSFVPIGATFSVCDIDLGDLVPRDILELFSTEIKQKEDKRIQQEKVRQRKLRREAKASAALAVQEKKYAPPSAAELAAMPQLSPNGDQEIQRSFQSMSMGGESESSFARIARLGFAATGPALHEHQSKPGGVEGTSPARANSVWGQSFSRAVSRENDSQRSQSLERSKKKDKKVLFSAASQRQY